MPSFAFSNSVYHGDHIANTASFVPLRISIGPEYYHLAARTWLCRELHSSRDEHAGGRMPETWLAAAVHVAKDEYAQGTASWDL